MGVSAKKLYDLRRIRTSIDQVAKKHEETLRRWEGGKFRMNFAQQLLEEVQPTVDIANNISSIP